MRRREFLGAAGAALAGMTARRVEAGGQRGAGNALRTPALVDAHGLELRAAPGEAGVGGGRVTRAWMYNGTLPGPTIRVKRGDEAQIILHNDLEEETITHWHGLIVPEAADGHPRFAVAPGEKYAYRFTVDQAPGLYWYHPHTHMRTAIQVHRGLAGLLVVEEREGERHNLPGREHELLLVLQDRTIAADGSMPMDNRGPTMMAGYFGELALVNGVADATAAVTPEPWRLRILNGSAARIYDLSLGARLPLTLVGSDGGFLPGPAVVDHCLLAPAERLDFIVDFSTVRGQNVVMQSRPFTLPAGGGGPMMRMMMGRQGDAMDVMRFSVSDAPSGRRASSPTLPSLAATPLPVGAREQRFVFSSMMMQHTINGRSFELTRPDVSAKAGSTERWTFINDSPFPHPVHLHAAQFLVRERRGGRGVLMAHESGWKDTVLVAPAEEVTVDVHFGPHRGLFLLHCHNLQHEDMGMMLNVAID